ncbi:MAG: hypothetical protein K9L59_14480 [Desulfobacterales bacterium]|nr:hypothetical protein [Desulfobacterales bacterium]MCF8078009.1 hypothetical protein [Desulfobacterales bacterium]
MTLPDKGRSVPARYKTAVLQRRQLSPGTVQLDLVRPHGFEFTAGQKIRLYRGNVSRDYSLASAPTAPFLSICVRIVAKGVLSPVLGAAKKNDSFSFTGPHGYFVFHPSNRHPVFVATGTGIAPFASICRSGVSGVTLLHGVRDLKQRYYAELFNRSAKQYVACLGSRKNPAQGTYPGRVTDFLAEKLPPGDYDFYLCGRREMIRDATWIIDDRFSGARIYTEIFY